MNLAIFDLDNTLLAGDSDYTWGNFLVAKGIVDSEYYSRENDRFYLEYQQKTLDIAAYQRFVLTPLMTLDSSTLEALRSEFMTHYIQPIRQTKADLLIQQHKDQGDTLLIITATNRFIAEPISQLLGIEHLLATEPEIINGQFTGNIIGDACFQEGKIRRLQQWLYHQVLTPQTMAFYSDSINDASLLHHVDKPVAVDPDDNLRQLAQTQQWPIISLRDDAKAS